jgi:hypothetical protein
MTFNGGMHLFSNANTNMIEISIAGQVIQRHDRHRINVRDAWPFCRDLRDGSELEPCENRQGQDTQGNNQSKCCYSGIRQLVFRIVRIGDRLSLPGNRVWNDIVCPGKNDRDWVAKQGSRHDEGNEFRW